MCNNNSVRLGGFSTFSSLWPNWQTNTGFVAHRLYNFSNATTVTDAQSRNTNK